MYYFSTELRKLYLDWARKEKGIAIADFYSLYSRLMNSPEKYGFKREHLKEGCIGHSCADDWREYIWFDDVSPHAAFLGDRSLADCHLPTVPSDDVCAFVAGRRGAQVARQPPVVELGAGLKWRVAF